MKNRRNLTWGIMLLCIIGGCSKDVESIADSKSQLAPDEAIRVGERALQSDDRTAGPDQVQPSVEKEPPVKKEPSAAEKMLSNSAYTRALSKGIQGIDFLQISLSKEEREVFEETANTPEGMDKILSSAIDDGWCLFDASLWGSTIEAGDFSSEVAILATLEEVTYQFELTSNLAKEVKAVRGTIFMLNDYNEPILILAVDIHSKIKPDQTYKERGSLIHTKGNRESWFLANLGMERLDYKPAITFTAKSLILADGTVLHFD
jgi:hypothetical protein